MMTRFYEEIANVLLSSDEPSPDIGREHKTVDNLAKLYRRHGIVVRPLRGVMPIQQIQPNRTLLGSAGRTLERRVAGHDSWG